MDVSVLISAFTTAARTVLPVREEAVMLAKHIWIAVLLLTSLSSGVATARAAETECDRLAQTRRWRAAGAKGSAGEGLGTQEAAPPGDRGPTAGPIA
jgi:hypothetical protein